MNVRDITIFAMLGAIMFLSMFLMQLFPSVHVLGLLIASITLTYRRRALIPIYTFVLLVGISWGFSLWWIPYLYIWLPLWLMFMAAGKFNIKTKAPLYMVLCALHGLSFGTLYAPAHALFFGLSFQATLAWIAAGLPFDIAHAISNFFAASLIVPLTALLKKLDSRL
ncbi:MAG: hypothetical protein FWF81_07405 [Defluviitaleaceae bacterium]|nr:hypothetical protein [Defluviitaleaceae bacterium]